MSGNGGTAGRRPFIHLHTHTEYSLLDGMSRIDEVVAIAKRDGMPAVAMTDHGNLHGALKFHRAAKAAGVKPILGMEAYMAPGSHRERNRQGENRHLVLLAKNAVGFRNLMKLTSMAHAEGFYFQPRMDLEMLERHHEGLIALSGCPAGELPRAILNGGDAMGIAGRYQEIFGRGNYFLEVMDHRGPDGKSLHSELASVEPRIRAGVEELARRTGIPLVGTNDSHYPHADDVEAHDVMLCISMNKPVSAPHRLRFDGDQFFFKSSAQMEQVFRDTPEAYRNTMEIAEAIEEFDLFEEGRALLPEFQPPEGRTLDEHFDRSVREGLEARLRSGAAYGPRPDRAEYESRLRLETDVIRRTGYSAYFLIVQDFVRFARKRGIPVGPARGSAGGSLIAYALSITDVDPLVHGLLFERFLNPDRVSPPDIDVDFCEFRREEVLDYVFERYGSDRTAHIVTTGTLHAKGAVRDVARMLELHPGEIDRLAKQIPDNATVAEALRAVPMLKEAARDPRIAHVFQLAQRLEGLPRQTGTHAAGVVIAPKPLDEILPLGRFADAGKSRWPQPRGSGGEARAPRRLTQYDMKDCEAVGLFKMDFLGLRNLTQIEDCAERIDADRELLLSGGKQAAIAAIRAFQYERVPPDPQVFALFAEADTDGIFQFEGRGVRELLRQYRPETLDDLAAMTALFRPGPLKSGMARDFVRAKQRERQSEKLPPRVRRLFPETRGLIVYQEQVMLAARELAGYSLAQADILRKAMGKKDPEVMRSQQERFVRGAVAKGLPRREASQLFEQIANFAGYGFNRSHAVGYALVAYVAAWLKTHFPVHFLASLLTARRRAGKGEKLGWIRSAAEARGLRILPPDVQRSGAEAEVEGGAVRYGLAAVKHVGEAAARAIVAARKSHGAFESLSRLAREVEAGTLNRGALEALTGAGALDFLDMPRSRILAAIPDVLRRANQSRSRDAAGVQPLFGAASNVLKDSFPQAPGWSEAERLRREFDAFGFYWSGHPAEEVREVFGTRVTGSIEEIRANGEAGQIQGVGQVRHLRKRKTRDGNMMGEFRLEDETGFIKVVAFPDTWRATPVQDEDLVVVSGELRKGRAPTSSSSSGGIGGEAEPEVIAESLAPPEAAFCQTVRRVDLIVVRPEGRKDALSDLIARHQPGRAGLRLDLRARRRYVLDTATRLRPDRSLMIEARALLGDDAVRLDGRPLPRFLLRHEAETPDPAAGRAADPGVDVTAPRTARDLLSATDPSR